MGPIRLIHSAHWVTVFLQSILDSDASSTSLIVCSSREAFLSKLYATAHAQANDSDESCQPLLTQPIGLLSRASKIRTVFCPTLEHLRAHLAVLNTTDDVSHNAPERTGRPLLAILDPLALHVPTSEFSAQGLSRTLATAVEVSASEGMDLVLCECRDPMSSPDRDSGEALWYVQVPLLNSSVRMPGQTVPVKRIVQRWFEFQ